jgi:hypothetical protein
MRFKHKIVLDFKDSGELLAFVKTFNWCQANIGIFKFEWDWVFGPNGTFEFQFLTPESASAFALRWV